MSVVPVTAGSQPSPVADPEAPAPGFDAALAAAGSGVVDVRELPSVPLGVMLTAYANGELRPAASRAPGEAQAAALERAAADGDTPADTTADAAVTAPQPAPGDDWGVATVRPEVVDGPGAAVLAAGERYLAVPYRWGGTDPQTGFDCSGFVQQVYADLGIRLPRVSIDQSRAGEPVADLAEAQPGDLVFWHGNGSRPNHIGIYAGDGTMLVAPRTGDVVRYQEITRTPDVIRRVIG